MMTRRDPAATRTTLLEAAFWEIYRRGFRAASLDAILRETGVTKGALYHHFPSKAALGHAVIEEVLGPYLSQRWMSSLDERDDPITAMQDLFTGTAGASEEEVVLGCPLNNLALEMSPVDEEFRLRIQRLFSRWRSGLAYALVRGQDAGTVREDVNANQVAQFIVASVEGTLGLAKAARSPEPLRQNMDVLSDYLESLRHEGSSIPHHPAQAARPT